MAWSGRLKAQLQEHAAAWAANNDLPHYKSLGSNPVVLFEPAAGGERHGNFQPKSWRAIGANPEWARRLEKTHSQQNALPPEKSHTAKELDSSNSSDALLMNCFCYPGVLERTLEKLGLAVVVTGPVFGFMAKVALADGTDDATEVDMRVGDLLVEAKLTEKDFTSRPREHVLRYRGLGQVFDIDALPGDDHSFGGYQLIRNVLAAVQHESSFTVFLDQRRPDLIQESRAVHAAISSAEVRQRCGFRTWQEIAAASPTDLRKFLEQEYGL
jgi:hypothetical protein